MKRIKTYMPEEDSTQYSKEYKSKLLPQIRKEERKIEKIYKTMYNYQNQVKVEEKIEKIKENIPNIKSKYELFLEQNKMDNNNIEENKINNDEMKQEKPINDWWGDIFK